jgi:hypothetical protein
VIIDVSGCWCFEHLRHCPDASCAHGAHLCESVVHYCHHHAEMGMEGRDADLAGKWRVDGEIAALQDEKQRLAGAGELTEAHGELIDLQIEGLRLRRSDPGDDLV